MEKTFHIHTTDGSILTLETTNLLLDRVCSEYMIDGHENVTDDHVKEYVLSRLLHTRGVFDDVEK